MHGPFGHDQPRGDLLVAQPIGEQLQHLVLTAGETERVPGSRAARATRITATPRSRSRDRASRAAGSAPAAGRS